MGKVSGLAWTSAGGDILNIEVAFAHGKGNLSLTGNLGDVMKESASTALGFVRSQAHFLGLSPDFFEKNDIFIHVPEGAIPKDGPSAGITLVTAIISALTQRGVLSLAVGILILTEESRLHRCGVQVGAIGREA